MDLNTISVTKAGKPIEGEPKPGRYYRITVPAGTDIRAAAKEMKKCFPKSFFVFRALSAPAQASTPAAEPSTQSTPPTKSTSKPK